MGSVRYYSSKCKNMSLNRTMVIESEWKWEMTASRNLHFKQKGVRRYWQVGLHSGQDWTQSINSQIARVRLIFARDDNPHTLSTNQARTFLLLLQFWVDTEASRQGGRQQSEDVRTTMGGWWVQGGITAHEDLPKSHMTTSRAWNIKNWSHGIMLLHVAYTWGLAASNKATSCERCI
jgi:hypothetical protein